MAMHQRNLHKHAKVVKKNRIDNNIKTTEELVKKMVNYQDENKGKNRPKLHEG